MADTQSPTDRPTAFPHAAILAMGIWCLSWAAFLGHIYLLTHDTTWIAKVLIAAAIIAFFLARGRNWARIIALMANAMAILFLLFLAYAFLHGHGLDLMITGANLLLFGIATYCLSSKGIRSFFLAQRESEAKASPGKGR